MNGNAVMYDVGKILTVGGAPAYQNANATSNAHVIDITNGVTVRKVASMSYARASHNSVVLPDGKVLVVGGESYPVPFSDDTSVLNPELWDPATETFTTMAAMTVPRNYHSVAMLLPDGRVFAGGGGLCGSCSTNHPDGQIFTPPYLLNADGTAAARPSIA
jgi:galactose oxidase